MLGHGMERRQCPGTTLQIHSAWCRVATTGFRCLINNVRIIVRHIVPRLEAGYFIFFLILFIEKKLFYSIVVIIMEFEGLAMDVTVNLHIKSHCIETEARNEFGRLMDRYFSTDDIEGELDEKIELLRDFLESSDFPRLRASDLRLSGGQESDVMIKRNEDGRIILEIR